MEESGASYLLGGARGFGRCARSMGGEINARLDYWIWGFLVEGGGGLTCGRDFHVWRISSLRFYKDFEWL